MVEVRVDKMQQMKLKRRTGLKACSMAFQGTSSYSTWWLYTKPSSHNAHAGRCCRRRLSRTRHSAPKRLFEPAHCAWSGGTAAHVVGLESPPNQQQHTYTKDLAMNALHLSVRTCLDIRTSGRTALQHVSLAPAPTSAPTPKPPHTFAPQPADPTTCPPTPIATHTLSWQAILAPS